MDDFGVTQRIDAVEKTIATPSANATLLGTTVKCPICGTENAPTEKYCGECGFLLSSTPGEMASVAFQAVLADRSGAEYFLREGENTVGRENADVSLPDPTVSRRHAVVILEKGRCLVKDSGSTNGTFVDGKPLAGDEAAELVDGAEVKFGSAILTLRLPETTEQPSEETDVVEVEAAPAEPAAEVEEVAEAEPVVAYLVSTSDPSVKFPIRPGANTIGRRSSNAVVLTGDAYVSGSHAELIAEDGRFRLVDVGSTNGTLLHGAPVQANESMDVSANDDITFGQTTLRLEIVEKQDIEE